MYYLLGGEPCFEGGSAIWIVRLAPKSHYTFVVMALLSSYSAPHRSAKCALKKLRKNYVFFGSARNRDETSCWGTQSIRCVRALLVRSASPAYYGGAYQGVNYHGERGGSGDPQSWHRRLPVVSSGSNVSVDDSPLTRASLLVQIRDGANAGAWQEFMQLYGPVVYGFARKRGLQDADAADLMQDVMRSVSDAIGRLDYDRSQGTFRGWLFTITRNKVFNFLAAHRIRPQGSGDTTTNQLLDFAARRRAMAPRSGRWSTNGGSRGSPWSESKASFRRTPGGRSGSRRSKGSPWQR